jgi:hypothetical protein
MGYEDPNPHDQVPRAVAREALALAREVPPAYTSARSRKDFTAHQLVAVLALKAFFKTGYRGIAQLLADLAGLREDPGPDKVPHYSTPCYAAGRVLKKGRPSAPSTAPPRPRPAAA